MKSVLISIQPKWCELIASGKKTVEVRKTKPKLETPFKAYIYCTNNGGSLHIGCGMYGKGLELYYHKSNIAKNDLSCVNGKVIGEFVCFAIECFTTDYRSSVEQTKRISEKSCVSISDLIDYEINSYCLFGWHISDLKIYDKPKKLNEFCHTKEYVNKKMNQVAFWECGIDDEIARTIRKPPQSWCYVESEG